MNALNRRQALQIPIAMGVVLASSDHAVANPDDDAKPAARDRDFVIAAGMTAEEADCWELTAKAAGKFFELPKLHPMDAQEVASAIHVIQNKLLSRPTYRKYLESARAGRGG
jgi:hypothetical protein